MRLPNLFQILRHLLLVILCLSSLWLVSSCQDIDTKNDSVLCLRENNSKQRQQNDKFSINALMESAQTRAYQSPVVFLGTLRSSVEQRDGTIRAWFAVNNPLKMNTSNNKEDTQVVYYRSGDGHCLLDVNLDNLKLGSQYLVFGAISDQYPMPSLSATALPIPNEKRILRAVKRILCDGCAKPAGISGLHRVRVEEGSKIQLHCRLSGNPIPWIEWYRNGAKIGKKGRMRVKTKRRTSSLVIRKARLSDKGKYECRAGNVVSSGYVSATTTVAVIRKKSKKPRPKTTSTSTTTTTTAPPTTTRYNPWATEPCPTSEFCLNGGTCVFYTFVREYVCHCADGFIGLRCDFKDVSITVGGVRSPDQKHDRLFIAILVLFVIFFCLNWVCAGVCWLCCLRFQRSKNWGKFREMPLLQKFLKRKKLSNAQEVSVDVAFELCDSDNVWNGDENNQNKGPRKTADDILETRSNEK